MKILLDECLPKKLKFLLNDFERIKHIDRLFIYKYFDNKLFGNKLKAREKVNGLFSY